jgi:hypothetical protein
MPLPAAILVLTSASLVTFAAAMLYALRGRQVNDHPICRKCGFDLFGRPAGSTRCSECGADLTRGRAIRTGRRERRRGLARVAGTGVLLSAVLLTGAGWTQVRRVNWQQHKPVWWLAREARSRQPGTRDASLAELARRISLGGRGKITDEQLAPLLDRAFTLQADTSQPWVPGWGLLIESAHDANRLSDSRWDLYRVQGFALRLKVRDLIRRGDPIPIEFWADPPRLGTTKPAMNVRILGGVADLAPELTIGGQVISDARHGPGTLVLSWVATPQLRGSAIYEPPASVFGSLSDGPQTAQVSCLVTLWEPSSYPPVGPQTRRPPVHQVLRASCRLVPSGTPTVGTAIDERRRPAVERSIRVMAADLDGTGTLTLSLDGKSAPVPMAFDVYVRQGEREWPVGPATFGSGGYAGPYVTARCPELAPGAAELILRPDPAAAVQTTGITTVWGDEIRIAPVNLRLVGFATTQRAGGQTR